MSSINDIKDLYTQIKVSETEGTLLSEQSFEIGPGHKEAQKTQKLYNKGSRTDNPHEKEQFLKRTGPQLPLAKAKPGMQVAGYEPEGDLVDEEKMTKMEKTKEKRLKSKYDKSGMKKSMIDQYGKEKGTQIYFATIRKQAMENVFVPKGEQLNENPLVGLGLRAGAAALGGYLASKGMEAAKKKVDSSIDKARKTSPIGGQRYDAQLKQLNQSFDYDDAYDYIIEMLVAADYAEDYESAEVMFEHISDEFTAAILEEYIEEKARGTRKKTTVHAYDVDETLFSHGKKGKPNVQVHVKDESGKRVQSLSNQEFNTHKLKPGHKYDFSEFQSAKKFKETSSPNKKVIKDIKRKQARGQNVHLITARSKFDKPSEFQGHLKKHGIDVEKSNIHYTGGMRGGDIGKKKVDVAKAVAKKSGAKSIHMYDDAAKVHKAFEKEKKESPSTKIKTHMVAPDKKGEPRIRSYQATKNEEMTAYEYWKQFIDEAADPKKDIGARMGNAISNTLRDVATGTGKDIKNLATTGKLKDTPERQRLRQGFSNFTSSAQNVINKAGGYQKPTSAKLKPATASGMTTTVLAKKGGVEGKLDKATGKFTPTAFSSAEKSRYGKTQAAAKAATEKKSIEAKNISGEKQKVTTNKAYDVKVGGVKGTATYGAGGQRMIRANLGPSVQVKAGKAKAGKSYGATLGGVKGTVKYDTKGGKTFQALQNKPKPTTVKTKTGNKPLISGGKNVFDGTPG